MTQFLKDKWRLLRMFKARRMYEINYRIIHNTAKIMGRAA
jgi:flagellar basal body rod protein FlgG